MKLIRPALCVVFSTPKFVRAEITYFTPLYGQGSRRVMTVAGVALRATLLQPPPFSCLPYIFCFGPTKGLEGGRGGIGRPQRLSTFGAQAFCHG